MIILPTLKKNLIFLLLPGGWLILSTVACILINFVTGYLASVISFSVFSSSGLAANIVMAVAVNLYPTQYRAMATSFILMCGRIGGVVGANIVGLLLESYCTSIFYFGGFFLACKLFHKFDIRLN